MKKILFLTIFIFAFCLSIPHAAAQYTEADLQMKDINDIDVGYRLLPASPIYINAHGSCAQVQHTSPYDLFVQTKTTEEWNDPVTGFQAKATISVTELSMFSCPGTCPNSICEEMAGENCYTCSSDCGTCCGNTSCDDGQDGRPNYGEDCNTCLIDCNSCDADPACGNNIIEVWAGEVCDGQAHCLSDCSGCEINYTWDGNSCVADCDVNMGNNCDAGLCINGEIQCDGSTCGTPTTKIALGSDPYGDCLPYTCTDEISGWSGNSCTRYTDGTANNGNCDGSGACSTLADSCSGSAVTATCGSAGCKKDCPSGMPVDSFNSVSEICYTSGQANCLATEACDTTGTCVPSSNKDIYFTGEITRITGYGAYTYHGNGKNQIYGYRTDYPNDKTYIDYNPDTQTFSGKMYAPFVVTRCSSRGEPTGGYSYEILPSMGPVWVGDIYDGCTHTPAGQFDFNLTTSEVSGTIIFTGGTGQITLTASGSTITGSQDATGQITVAIY